MDDSNPVPSCAPVLLSSRECLALLFRITQRESFLLILIITTRVGYTDFVIPYLAGNCLVRGREDTLDERRERISLPWSDLFLAFRSAVSSPALSRAPGAVSI